jgi:hypothetical protein
MLSDVEMCRPLIIGIVFGFMKAFCVVHQAFPLTCSCPAAEPFLPPLVPPVHTTSFASQPVAKIGSRTSATDPVEHPFPCSP